MSQWVPVPKLTEKRHPDNRTRVRAASPALQTNRCVPSTSINETLTDSGTEPCHRVLVLIRNNLLVFGTS